MADSDDTAVISRQSAAIGVTGAELTRGKPGTLTTGACNSAPQLVGRLAAADGSWSK